MTAHAFTPLPYAGTGYITHPQATLTAGGLEVETFTSLARGWAVRVWRPERFTDEQARAAAAIVRRSGAPGEIGDRGLFAYKLSRTGAKAVAAALFAALR